MIFTRSVIKGTVMIIVVVIYSNYLVCFPRIATQTLRGLMFVEPTDRRLSNTTSLRIDLLKTSSSLRQNSPSFRTLKIPSESNFLPIKYRTHKHERIQDVGVAGSDIYSARQIPAGIRRNLLTS